MRIEQWKPVIGWEGFYEVSDIGRVRSMPRKIVRRDGTLQSVSERILRSSKNSKGYLVVRLSDAINGKTWSHVPQPPAGRE